MSEELSAVLVNKKMLVDNKNLAEAKRLLLEIHNLATSEPYSFLFINLMKTNVNEIFMKNFTSRLVVEEEEDI